MSNFIEPTENHRFMAQIISVVLWNSTEKFRLENLSDEQMQELTPLIQNSIFTALHAAGILPDSREVQDFIQGQVQSIPLDWDPPRLLRQFAPG